MIRWLVGVIGLSLVATHALAADPVEIGIGYLGQAGIKSKLSLVEQPAENDGIAGARLAIEDNNTTGKFLNQRFTLEEIRLKDGDDVGKAATALAGAQRLHHRRSSRRRAVEGGRRAARSRDRAVERRIDSTTGCASRIAAPM